MKAPKQADTQAQKELVDLVERKATEITLSSGKKIKVGYIMPDTQDKIDDILVSYEVFKKKLNKDDIKDINRGNKETRKVFAKCAAAILINNPIGITLFWWLRWRIIYHFWSINGDDYIMLISEAKKKAMEQQYYLAMALLMTMKDTWTMMTKKEAEAYHQELELASKQPS